MNIRPLKISASWARKALARELAARRELSFAGRQEIRSHDETDAQIALRSLLPPPSCYSLQQASPRWVIPLGELPPRASPPSSVR